MGGKRKLVEGGGGDDDATSKSSRRPGVAVDVDQSKVAAEVADNAADRRSVVGTGGDSSMIVTMETNPLLNEVILQNLFSHMPVELLATSRLVCRSWRDAALSSWRASAILRISRTGENQYFLTDRAETPIQEFLSFLKAECALKPYRQFRLERWRLQEPAEMDGDAARFWKVAGSSITELGLENCTSSRSEAFFQTINNSCPSLEALVLSQCVFGVRGYRDWLHKLNEEQEQLYKEPVQPVHGEHPNLRSLRIVSSGDGYFLPSNMRLTQLELLTHFPHLTTLNVEESQYWRSAEDTEVLQFLRVVELIRREDPRKLPITKLSGFVVVVDDLTPRLHQDGQPPALVMADLLRELNLPLQSVELTDNLDVDEVRNFVEIYGGRIVRLVVDWIDITPPRCNFPFGVALPNLEQLNMPEGFCVNFDFLKYAPNLKSLMIEGVYSNRRGKPTLIQSTSKSSLANTELFSLTKLVLAGFTVTEEDLRWMVKWMPRVKILMMTLDDQQFPIVCKNWQDLIKLTVMGNRLTDKGVTGRMKFSSMTTRSGMGRWEKATRPNITSLQNLKVFVAPEAILTEGSLTHGLLKMRCLRRIFFAGIERIGVQAKEALRRKDIEISDDDWE